jgi:hypothetical protein
VKVSVHTIAQLPDARIENLRLSRTPGPGLSRDPGKAKSPYPKNVILPLGTPKKQIIWSEKANIDGFRVQARGAAGGEIAAPTPGRGRAVE